MEDNQPAVYSDHKSRTSDSCLEILNIKIYLQMAYVILLVSFLATWVAVAPHVNDPFISGTSI